MLLKIEIQTPLMMLLALAAVLVSLPAIKKFQFTKDGFSIESAEHKHATAAAAHRTKESPLDKDSVSSDTANNTKRAIAPRAMGIFYGAISGLLSASLGTLSYFNIDKDSMAITSSWPAPPIPAIFYSAALFGLFVRFRSIDKLQLLLIPFVVYGAWTAGFRTAYELGLVLHYATVICGLASGFIGALLLTLGLCIFIKELRSPAAILAISAVGAITGTLLVLPSPQIESYAPLYFPVFIGWQSLVSFTIVFFMTSFPGKFVLKAS